MSLYNMLFGVNTMSDSLLKMLDLTRGDVGRFRDCYLKKAEGDEANATIGQLQREISMLKTTSQLSVPLGVHQAVVGRVNLLRAALQHLVNPRPDLRDPDEVDWALVQEAFKEKK